MKINPTILKNLIFASFLILIGLNCRRQVNESEPDNNRKKNAELLLSDQNYRGSFYSRKGRDKDFILYKIKKGHMIRGKLTGVKGVNSEIVLYKLKNKRKPFKTIDDSLSSLGETFGPLWIDPPGVIIRIRPTHNVNNSEYKNMYYTFKANLFAPATPIEYEPNDSFYTAQEIKLGSIIGYYSNVFNTNKLLEKDYYYINVKEDKKYSIKVKLSGVDGVDAILRIFSSKGDRLKTINEKGVSQGEELNSYGIQGPSKLYFSVTANDHKINYSQYYHIKVKKEEYQSQFELEPNDIKSKSTLLQNETTKGQLSDRYDIDYYCYLNKNPYPVQLSLKLIPGDNLNPRIEFFKSKHQKAMLFDDGGKEENEGISNRKIMPRTKVFFKIFTLDWEGNKSINYTLHLSESQIIDNTEIEPNNSSALANELLPDSSVVAFINPNVDVDYYVLKTNKKQLYKIMIDGIPGCKLSLTVATKKNKKTYNRISRYFGDGISLTAMASPKSLIIVNCKQSTENLLSSPYSLSVQSMTDQ